MTINQSKNSAAPPGGQDWIGSSTVAFRRHSTLADSDSLFDIKTERPEAGPHDLRGMFAIIVQARACPI
ncbi:hypothetical protein J2X19_004020 [Rhodoferax ferrireducens]|uniref:Uncharacterized protein n=1 Tax=Rhodoferax ferrireducens TaxID=192843 RepID=A0ABU2CDD3_9BURK|nr:hypothetical protein [Rhodoferax ferrireducens]MDR7379326.1 hypothetical protein [Rhodoferax ferrireducens]